MFNSLGEIIVFGEDVDWLIKSDVILEWLFWIDKDSGEDGLLNVCECLLIMLLLVVLFFFGDELCSGRVKLLIFLLMLFSL